MSKGFGKKALIQTKKGSKPSSNHNSPNKFDNKHTSSSTIADEDKLMVKFVFEGEKFHARTPICFDTLNLSDLLNKINLDITLPPPSAQELFESYFKEDIYPYIRHNIQSQIRNKRDITKLWELQSIILQNIYEERAKLLHKEWRTRKNKHNQSKSSNGELDEEALEKERKKEELKAKNKQKKKNWQELIAMQIASGQFDDNAADSNKSNNDHNNNANSHKKHKRDKKEKQHKKKETKPAKKKKIKKWKDKKEKKVQELWPAAAAPKDTTKTNKTKQQQKNNQRSSSVAEHLKKIKHQNQTLTAKQEDITATEKSNNDKLHLPQQQQPHNGHHHHKQQQQQQQYNNHNHHNMEQHKLQKIEHRISKLIKSELNFKMLIRSEYDQHLVCDENDEKQIEQIKPFIDGLSNINQMEWIKIWIYIGSYPYDINQKEIFLNTDKDSISLSINQLTLFQIFWGDFGNAVKQRIDSPNIDAAFVKKSKALRLKIPILSM